MKFSCHLAFFQDRHAEEVRQKALNSKVEQNEAVAVTCG